MKASQQALFIRERHTIHLHKHSVARYRRERLERPQRRIGRHGLQERHHAPLHLVQIRGPPVVARVVRQSHQHADEPALVVRILGLLGEYVVAEVDRAGHHLVFPAAVVQETQLAHELRQDLSEQRVYGVIATPRALVVLRGAPLAVPLDVPPEVRKFLEREDEKLLAFQVYFRTVVPTEGLVSVVFLDDGGALRHPQRPPDDLHVGPHPRRGILRAGLGRDLGAEDQQLDAGQSHVERLPLPGDRGAVERDAEDVLPDGEKPRRIVGVLVAPEEAVEEYPEDALQSLQDEHLRRRPLLRRAVPRVVDVDLVPVIAGGGGVGLPVGIRPPVVDRPGYAIQDPEHGVPEADAPLLVDEPPAESDDAREEGVDRAVPDLGATVPRELGQPRQDRVDRRPGRVAVGERPQHPGGREGRVDVVPGLAEGEAAVYYRVARAFRVAVRLQKVVVYQLEVLERRRAHGGPLPRRSVDGVTVVAAGQDGEGIDDSPHVRLRERLSQLLQHGLERVKSVLGRVRQRRGPERLAQRVEEARVLALAPAVRTDAVPSAARRRVVLVRDHAQQRPAVPELLG
ncbi:hypothetical protein THAOC_00247, partial [Thalassiosira oceanica]